MSIPKNLVLLILSTAVRDGCCVCSPEFDNNLLCFLHIQREIGVFAQHGHMQTGIGPGRLEDGFDVLSD